MLLNSGRHTYETVDEWPRKADIGALVEGITDIAVDSKDRLWALTRGPVPVVVFDHNGKLLNSWGKEYFGPTSALTGVPGGFTSFTHGICIGPDGSVWVTDCGYHTVSKFTPEGKLLMQLGTKGKPSDTGFPGWPNIRIPGITREGVRKLLMDAFLKKTKPGKPFNMPDAVCVLPSGEFYVADGYGNTRVHKFDAKGNLLFSWGELGTGPGQFMVVHSVTVDRRGRVWIADRENNRIQVFDADGKFLFQLKDLDSPGHIFIDKEETVFITEFFARRLAIFTIDGKLLARWQDQDPKINKEFQSPHSNAMDSKGNLYLANSAGDISRYLVKCTLVK